jgi:hypothetical protein
MGNSASFCTTLRCLTRLNNEFGLNAIDRGLGLIAIDGCNRAIAIAFIHIDLETRRLKSRLHKQSPPSRTKNLF